ncbi:hypothetical protein VSAK1_26315 [Vibrio mediterranei AK1]|uniref:hypothetical protein n=1 Tax=Vibrio mediterranei TaxID=689 RepID=UPI000154121D|nr:hypothetical protein [Vibrio mediterranei]EDL53757.1 hypothetical protein VSAK1_26315 [Vibrio mediterranei AK1]
MMYAYQIILENREIGFSIYFTTEQTMTIYHQPDQREEAKFLMKLVGINSVLDEEGDGYLRFKCSRHIFTDVMDSYDERLGMYQFDENDLAVADVVADSIEWLIGNELDLVFDSDFEEGE